MVLSVLRPTLIVVGPDHRFGWDRLGDARFMAGLQERYRFRLEVVPEFRQEGAPVKSTRIRERLILGAVRPAAELLGYRYCVSGTIRPGRGVGTELGFPTANLAVEPPEKLIPPSGVYAGFARLGSATEPRVNCHAGASRHNTGGHEAEAGRWPAEDRHPCAINIGFRPTFDGQYQTIEAHLLDTTPVSLHDRAMTLEFVERLRPEQKFPSVDALKAQIAADLALARLILAEA
jgi:FAD synthase